MPFSSRLPVVRATVMRVLLLLVIFPALPARGGEAAIASAHPLATEAGREILQQGGNAFDAAVAVAAVLAVVEPYASGLGGGGFFLLHEAASGRNVMLDAREAAPGDASPRMYLGEAGQPKGRLSMDGALAAGIPGTPAALDWLARRYGRLPLSATLEPAIRHAREGFAADVRYVNAAGARESALRADPASAQLFLDDASVPKVGFLVRQPALAATLQVLAERGREGFYRGDLARRLVAGVQIQGGIWTLQDLADYHVIERTPTTFTYRGARITTASLPSSGGLVLAQVLQILDRFPLAQLARTERDHLVVEALRRGYQDRARYLGDPDYIVPPAMLDTRSYADLRAASIELARATPSERLEEHEAVVREGANTTHFSIVDADDNRVAATLSVNLPFGAAALAGDTGVLLNNTMNDFSLGRDVTNAYQLVGHAANAVEGGKRPLSSMSPTFLEDQRGVLVLGSPGGSRIISMVLLGILDYVHEPVLDIGRLVGLPRYHHQYLPDRIEYEPDGFSAEWLEAMQAKGHEVQKGRRKWGNMQAVFFDKRSGTVSAHNDPRGRVGVLF